MDQKPHKGMGLPEEWTKPGTVFVRTFRWTLDPPNHPDVSAWIQKVNINYKNKTIEIEAYEEIVGITHAWIQDLICDASSREFTINHYDGCGTLLFNIVYSGIEVVDHKVGYNYESSDVLTQKLWLTYRRIKRSGDLRTK